MEESKKQSKHTEKSEKIKKFRVYPYYGLLILLAAAGGYFVNNLHYTVYELQNELKQIRTKPDRQYFKDQITSIKKENTLLFDKLENKMEQNRRETNKLKLHIVKISSQLKNRTSSSYDVTILEIRSGLNMASWILAYSYNIDAATKLLMSLDEKASLLTNNSSSIRQSLANDIIKLKEAMTIDQVGLFTRIESIKRLIPKLVLQQSSVVTTAQEEEFIPSDDWRGYIDKGIYLLKQLVVFKRHEKQVSPLLSPENKEVMSQNMQLILSQIQWAITYRHAEIYSQLVKQAIDTIKNNFALDDQTNITVIDTLEELLDVDINPDIPKLESVKLVNSLMSPSNQLLYNTR